jgi:hypothetical protein
VRGKLPGPGVPYPICTGKEGYGGKKEMMDIEQGMSNELLTIFLHHSTFLLQHSIFN